MAGGTQLLSLESLEFLIKKKVEQKPIGLDVSLTL